MSFFGCIVPVVPPSGVTLDSSNTIDTNSLVPGYLGDPAWNVEVAATSGAPFPKFTAVSAVGPDGLSGYVVDANPGLLTAVWSRYFTAPEAVTWASIVASVECKLAPGAVAGTVTVQITAANDTVILQTASVTTSSSWQTVTTPSQALTPGTKYRIRVVTTGTHALFGRVKAVGTTPSDAWWSGTIKRQSVHAKDFADNSFNSDIDARAPQPAIPRPAGGQIAGFYYYVDPDSTYSFTFNGTRFGIEILTTDNQFGLCGLDVLVNGILFTKVQGTNLLSNDIAQVTGLPAGAKTITIQTAAQKWLQDYTSVRGAWVNAIYTDSVDTMTPAVPPAPGGTIVLFGTSKCAGFFAGGEIPSGDPSAGGLVVGLRTGQSKRVIGKAIGTVSLWAEYIACGNIAATTGGSIMPMIQDIIRAAPAVFICEADRNDAADGNWPSVAAWSTQYQFLLDTLHYALPHCSIWMIYTTNETSVVPNLAAFDAEQDVILAARPWLNKMDLRTLWTMPGANFHTVDGIHPDTGGYALITAYMLSRLAAP